MKLEELTLGSAMGLIELLIEAHAGEHVIYKCRRGHINCALSIGYYCVHEAFEAIAADRRNIYGISAPATPSGSIKAT